MSATGLSYATTGRELGWQATRAWVLVEAGGRCVRCDEPATDVDHIWPRYWGGTDHYTNLQALCGTCNKRKGNEVDWAQATSEQLGWAADAALERAERALNEFEVIAAASVSESDLRSLRWTVAVVRDTASVVIARIDARFARFPQ